MKNIVDTSFNYEEQLYLGKSHFNNQNYNKNQNIIPEQGGNHLDLNDQSHKLCLPCLVLETYTKHIRRN
jgi:hypothetical protein